jgi:2-polyprenyl-3-methyl-5-hydroxy-6-metoxy-1,4-benzoquinol methylase
MSSEEKSGIERWQNVIESVPDEEMTLPPYFAHQIKSNIRHLLITFARYKFAARMMGDFPKRTVIEFGCNAGLGTLHLSQVAAKTVAVDQDEKAIQWAKANLKDDKLEFRLDDFLGKKYGSFDTAISLDVIEHIEREKEDLFLQTIFENLNNEGFAIIGTPNIAAATYASEASRIGHINLYDHQRLKDLFLRKFNNVFLFGMNDEVVHTGFLPMTHYIMALCVNPKEGNK